MQNLIAESSLSELSDRGIDLTDSVMLELGAGHGGYSQVFEKNARRIAMEFPKAASTVKQAKAQSNDGSGLISGPAQTPMSQGPTESRSADPRTVTARDPRIDRRRVFLTQA